jgi:hypothetical protein
MKLSKLFMIALLAGTLALIGCGDDTTTSDNGGNGGTTGTGGSSGTDPDALCTIEACAVDSDVGRAAKAVCVKEINNCIAAGLLPTDDCIKAGTETCTF